MQVKYNLYVGNGKAQKGWIRLLDFNSFINFFAHVDLERIESVYFGSELDDEDNDYSDTMTYNIADCVSHLMIDVARSKRLPQCFSDNIEIRAMLDNYNNTYKYDNYCGQIRLNKTV